MQKAASKALAFRLLAATSALSLTAAFLAVTAPPAHAASVGGVQGTVKNEAGQALRGVQVLLIPVGGGAPQPARTDSSGYYSFAGVQPGTYTIQINLVTYNSASQAITIAQDINTTVDVTLTPKTGVRVGAGIRIPLTKPTETGQIQPITHEDERREISQPNNAKQSTGLLNFKVGVTTDAGQYPHVRGSDGNQIDWSIDGIDLRDPVTNQFATNLVTAGISTSNLISGGADASYGGSAGAYLNQISANGREISKGKPVAGYFENTNGPGSKWGYSGGDVQVGGVLANNKLDYALSSIVFRTKYGDNTQLGELHSSHDEVGKFNFYATPNDTATVFFAHGAENYNQFQTAPNSLFFDPDKVLTDPTSGRQYTSARNLDGTFNDHNVQTYNLDHFTYKHNFAPSTYIQYRIYQLHQAIPFHAEATGNFFNFDRTNVTGNQINFYSQLNKSSVLQAGLEYKDAKGSFRRQIVSVQRGPITGDPITGGLSPTATRYSDRTYNAYPKDFAFYVQNRLQTAQNKIVFNYGLRFQSTTYTGGISKYAVSKGLDTSHEFTTKSTDPRLGLTYTPIENLTFRTSYTVNSQHADERRIQRLGPEDVGDVGTSLRTDPLTQSREAYRAQGFSRVALSHSKDFDLGVEKGFQMKNGPLSGSYNFSVTGYQKYGYDLAFLNSADYTNPASRFLYDNSGTQHASGFEFSFRKVQRKPSDWSGYVNYTNQVVRTNSSLYDTAYAPYFSNYLGTSGAFSTAQLPGLVHREFAPSWDQRHTVGVVATKRFTKLLETSFILDAGSGLPYYTSGTDSGNFGSIGTGFADIGGTTRPGQDFTQVPISLGGGQLPRLNPLVGYTGWHYKITLNNSFYLTPSFSLFLNVDNVFDKKTALSLATGTFSGEPYYVAPTAAYPQGQQVYRYQAKLTPVYITFGFRQRF